jgi:hypothetical protein
MPAFEVRADKGTSPADGCKDPERTFAQTVMSVIGVDRKWPADSQDGALTQGHPIQSDVLAQSVLQ